MDPCPERPLAGEYLDPVKANIQLDTEKMAINSPDPAPATTTSESHPIANRLLGTEDVEMGEPAAVNSQDKDVGRFVVRDQTDAYLFNPATRLARTSRDQIAGSAVGYARSV